MDQKQRLLPERNKSLFSNLNLAKIQKENVVNLEQPKKQSGEQKNYRDTFVP